MLTLAIGRGRHGGKAFVCVFGSIRDGSRVRSRLLANLTLTAQMTNERENETERERVSHASPTEVRENAQQSLCRFVEMCETL